jgi:iron complex outermembrane recepter protein
MRRVTGLFSSAAAITIAFAAASAAHAAETDFHIAPQPLRSALLQFGLQAGRTVVFGESVKFDQMTSGLTGKLDADDALRELLKGAGLSSRRSGQTYLITGQNMPPAATVRATEEMPSSPQPDANKASSDDIVVTANRREEAIQKVAVSVQAFGSEALRKENVKNTYDIQRLVPGVIFTHNGGASSTMLFIRGQGRNGVGASGPSVMSYVNDVPLTDWAAAIPTFDMSSVQVLKGPQGTLFGRNTTGGAVLTYTKPPTYELGGYLQGLIGSYNWKEVEGAFNLPLVKDKLAIRLAARAISRDGYTKSGLGGPAADNQNSQAFRASILFEPTDWFKNVTVYDHFESNEIEDAQPVGYPSSAGPNGRNAVFRAFPATTDCNTSPSCDFDLALARQQAVGPRVYFANQGYPHSTTKIDGVSNTSTLDLGSATIKNIFGYRGNRLHSLSDTDGTEIIGVNTENFHSDDQITDELQFSGAALDNSLHWLVGGFLLENVPGGPNALRFDEFRAPTQDPNTWSLDTVQNYALTQRSHAVFASLSQNLDRLLPGLKINASARYTWDSITVCGVTTRPFSSLPAEDFQTCRTKPAAFVSTARFQKPTWSLGADYQATDQLFLYIVTRRGYRAGGLNSPNLGGSLARYQTFDPQILTDVEGGLKADWNIGTWRGRTNVSAYYGKYDSLQTQAVGIPPNFDGDNNPTDDPSGTSILFNAGSATEKGVDVDGFISPFGGLRFTYAGSWFDGEISYQNLGAITNLISGDKHFDQAPKFSYSVGVQYTFPEEIVGGELSFNADWYWVDHRKVNFLTFQSYHLMSASLNLKNIGGRSIDASLFVDNVTNETYISNTILSGASPGVLTAAYGPPRMFGLRLRYDFSGI